MPAGNVEGLAGVYNSFHFQSELRYSVMDFAGSQVTVPAYYVQAAYLLTGEVRPYNKTAGVLGRIKPLRPFGDCGGWGAWEVAARYSDMNLNPTVPFQAVPPVGQTFGGGHLHDWTLGLNWYLNQHTKFQLNYIIANSNRLGVSSSCDILALRAQLDF